MQLKGKKKYPLHAAVSHGREDVVFLYLVEFESQLPSLMNEVCGFSASEATVKRHTLTGSSFCIM
jgi:hypothetical protein